MNTLSSMMSIGRRAEKRLFLIKICLENSELVSGFFLVLVFGGFFGAKCATSYPLFPICGNVLDILQAY